MPRRPAPSPIRLVLEQSARDFAWAIVDAVRGATVAELRELSGAARRVAPSGPRASRPERTPRARGGTTRRATQLALPFEHGEEIAPPAEAIIDAVALLDAMDRATRAPSAAPATPAPRGETEEPEPPPRSGPVVAARPAAREGEAVLRTAKGTAVLRRRRAAEVSP